MDTEHYDKQLAILAKKIEETDSNILRARYKASMRDYIQMKEQAESR